jgi:hypothetical protein
MIDWYFSATYSNGAEETHIGCVCGIVWVTNNSIIIDRWINTVQWIESVYEDDADHSGRMG